MLAAWQPRQYVELGRSRGPPQRAHIGGAMPSAKRRRARERAALSAMARWSRRGMARPSPLRRLQGRYRRFEPRDAQRIKLAQRDKARGRAEHATRHAAGDVEALLDRGDLFVAGRRRRCGRYSGDEMAHAAVLAFLRFMRHAALTR